MARSTKERGDYQEKDLEIFKFLWKWKLATTSALALRFFPNRNTDTAYNRLVELKKRGFIVPEALDSAGWKFVWVLTPKGFRTVRDSLKALKEEGFRSEHPEHDHYVMACHLGEWLVDQPSTAEFFTEQELRRYKLDNYLSWVPKTESHRPDGYWLSPYKESLLTIALEVELHFKGAREYEVLARFYQDNPSIARVVWLTGSAGDAKSIQGVFEKESKSTYLKHNFVLLKDFQRTHWQSNVLLGYEQGKTLAYALGIRSNNLPVHPECRCTVGALLDTRKRRLISALSAPSRENRNPNCMAPRPISVPIYLNPISSPSNISADPIPLQQPEKETHP